MDAWQERALGNLTKRHEDKIRNSAESLREYAGYLLRNLDAGHVTSFNAQQLLSDAQEIVNRIAALEAVKDTAGILGTSNEAAVPAGGEGGQ